MNSSTTLAANGIGGFDSQHQDVADTSVVLSALSDDDNRRILAACDDAPRTAQECAEVCDIPLSSVYRKLSQLSEASLLDEGRRIQTSAHHPREFSTRFDTLSFSFGDSGVSVDFRQVATDGGEETKER
ncbi:helix-turn-helix domain-containing protein [Haloferax sp. MBLA0076]|uniref:Helix-turn-helix domain-containing protein n=1 Tax=Haloferax litoreum TaxID=2666140 RepID=A0A6A8GCX2_9EURY|nr:MULTISPECIES: helix-turn-helix domain-containing protein [Haloferax]KAB1192458.1 helix-turn-helix transcriptional regulator [Haloferax sp. CBA1148]MRX20925.1 helix-turn-helix domain-containing protein [Haloferax litoreum]